MGALINTRAREVDLSRLGVFIDPSVDLTSDVEALLSDANYAAEDLNLIGITTNTDSYEADSTTTAFYLNTETEVNDNLSMLAGLRLEQSEQELAYPNSSTSDNTLETDEVLPVVAFTYRKGDSWQFRAGYSRTISRPDIIERSETSTVDSDNRTIIGNPDLEESLIDNIDFRAEYYLSDEESLSVALFFKNIDKPIERGIPDGSGSAADGIIYRNNESASVYGLEFDINKDFDFSDSLTGFVAGNLALTESEIDLSEDSARFEPPSSASRDLQGLSPILANVQFGLDHIETEQKFTVLFNFIDDRIDQVGRNTESRIEKGRTLVDLAYEKAFSETFSLKAKVKNLLDEEVEFTRDGVVEEIYEVGTEYSISVDIKL